MANEIQEISQITINDISYNLCDATARNYLVSKQGDTLNGNLVFAKKNNNDTTGIYFRPNDIINDDTPKGYCSSTYLKLLKNSDNDYNFTLGVQGIIPQTSEYSEIQNIKLGGTYSNNQWNPSISVSAPIAWRNALKAMGTEGNNTISDGSLTINPKANSHTTGYLRVNGSTPSRNTTTIYDGRIYIPADGAITTKNIRGTNYDYKLIGDNGENLWIGAGKGAGSFNHTGKTFISTGWESNDSDTGNETIWISVPSGRKSDWSSNGSTNYRAYHQGNLSKDFTVVYKSFKFTSNKKGFTYYPFTQQNGSTTVSYLTFKEHVRPIAAWGTLITNNGSLVARRKEFQEKIDDYKERYPNTKVPSVDEQTQDLFASANSLGNNPMNITQVILSPVTKITLNGNIVTKITGGFWNYSDTATQKTAYANIAFLCMYW